MNQSQECSDPKKISKCKKCNLGEIILVNNQYICTLCGDMESLECQIERGIKN